MGRGWIFKIKLANPERGRLADERGRLRRLPQDPRLSPDALSAARRHRPRSDAGAHRRVRHRRPVRRHSRRPSGSPRRSTCANAHERDRGRAPARPHGRAQRRGGFGSVLSRRRRLSPPRAGDGRPSDPALGVPDQLHALPARDRPGHAAGAVRVPDPGRGADRHGGRQRLDVRRLDRLRRGDPDGASPDPAAQGGAVGRPASAICRCRRDARRHGRRRDRPPAARPAGQRGHRGADRRRDELRGRPVARLLRQSARSRADRRRRPRQGRAAGRRVHRGGVARRGAVARRDGRRHRRRRRPVDRQRAELRRPVCRSVRHDAEECAADARPAGRRDGRRRRAAQLRADAVDPRAAHPAREGDEQHLHQLGPMRPRLLDPPDAARRNRPAPPRDAQPRRGGRARRAARRDQRRRACSPTPSSTNSPSARRRPAAGADRRAGGARRDRRPAGVAAGAARRPRRSDRRRRHRDFDRRSSGRPTPRRWRNRCETGSQP